MNKLWQYWSETLGNDVIDNLIQIGETYPLSTAALGFNGETKNNTHRSSEIRWIPISFNQNQFVKEILWHYASEANKNAFGFHIDSILDVQYTTYRADQEGKYDWHIDTFWANPTSYDRKISVVVQLTDPVEYEGGDFQLDPQYEQPSAELIKKKGSIIVFPSFIAHRVTPVTAGVRRSLVTWVQGPKFK